MKAKSQLDIEILCKEARFFAKSESKHNAPSLFGVTDGKAVGTYFEHKFKKYLLSKYDFSAGNSDDITAFLYERMLPIDEIEAKKITEDILKSPPEIGYLTISSALQWRLQYSRIIKEAGKVNGILRVH